MSDVKNSAGNEMKGEESVCISRSTVRMRLGVRPYQRGTLSAQIDDRRKSSVGVGRFWLNHERPVPNPAGAEKAEGVLDEIVKDLCARMNDLEATDSGVTLDLT